MNTHTKTIIAVAGFMLGIACGEVSEVSTMIAVLAMVMVVMQGGIYFGERKRKMMSDAVGVAHHFSFSLITILFSLGLFFGIVRSQLVEEKNNFVCEKVCTFEARINSSPETKNDFQVFSVQPLGVENEILDVQVKTSLYPKYQIGETLKISGKVKIPEIVFPHENKKIFDYESYLKTKNIGSEITYPKIETVSESSKSFSDSLGRLNENFVSRIEKNVDSPASSLGSGMLFGSSSISKDLSQTFRVAGLSHIIVLSGFNIVIVITAILFLFSFLPLILRVVLASISVVTFVVMVGAEPSVVRATLMAFVSLVAMVVGREYVAKQALILSLFAIVMYDPYSLLHSASLHLSFLATVGIVYLVKPVDKIFEKYFSKISSKTFREIFVTSLSAYLTTMPYIMYMFGTVSVYSLLSNILVLPLVPPAMLLSFLVVVSSFISETLSSIFGLIDTMLINTIIAVARFIEHLPLSSFPLSVSFQIMCAVYICIISAVIYLSVKNKNETCETKVNGNLTDIISY